MSKDYEPRRDGTRAPNGTGYIRPVVNMEGVKRYRLWFDGRYLGTYETRWACECVVRKVKGQKR